jgi:hypothetical protein
MTKTISFRKLFSKRVYNYFTSVEFVVFRGLWYLGGRIRENIRNRNLLMNDVTRIFTLNIYILNIMILPWYL